VTAGGEPLRESVVRERRTCPAPARMLTRAFVTEEVPVAARAAGVAHAAGRSVKRSGLPNGSRRAQSVP
jgi:hypothetical protein